ncbi:MAG: hypothetical protein KBD94_04420 [Pyrinomonadaceae bacterium]|nr:hypothetical protein [Pyrinomonadaceae bacterium]
MLRLRRNAWAVVCVFAACFILTVSVQGQQGDFKPGDRIDYLDYGKWETGGTFVGETPGGKQPIIRKRPNEYDAQGSQTAWDWERIRPAAGAKPPAQPPAPQPPRNPPRQQDPPPPPANDPPEQGGDEDGGERNGCAAVLTQDDVAGFLRRKLGTQKPFEWQKKERVENELAGMIRDCGLGFRFVNNDAFSAKLDQDFYPNTTTRSPLMANFGPPTPKGWYNGTWLLTTQSEDYWLIVAAKAGFLTINANGTYIWKNGPTDPPARYVKGNWREATVDEMRVAYQGGAGIVLLNAVGGDDWIVRHNRDSRVTASGKWIAIELLENRKNRFDGYRK